MSKVWLVVGLGNPGARYEQNRHNIGFNIVEQWARQLEQQAKWQDKFKSQVLVHKSTLGNIVLLKPQTFMNLSGEAVGAAAAFYKVAPENVLVVHDELDFPLGKIKFGFNHSAGGHNGIKSIIAHLGTQEFARLRFGIGQPDKSRQDVSDYVLQNFPKADSALVQDLVKKAVQACDLFCEKGLAFASNYTNRD